MNVGVLTLTRDRLSYTQRSFRSLEANAGCEYTHFVLDQASEDGTRDWLYEQVDLELCLLEENIGICRGLNLMLDELVDASEFDVLVRFDNDCEVIQPDTLQIVASLAMNHAMILAPRVLGLKHPPSAIGRLGIDGYSVDLTTHLGGIFMAIPTQVFADGFRFDETAPLWTGDEMVCPWYRMRGGRCGYVDGVEVSHYLGTDGQIADEPDYFARAFAEGKPSA